MRVSRCCMASSGSTTLANDGLDTRVRAVNLLAMVVQNLAQRRLHVRGSDGAESWQFAVGQQGIFHGAPF